MNKSKLVRAMQTNDTTTENGMLTHSTSGYAVLDLFFKMGGLRANPDEVIPAFRNALDENVLLAIKAMFYNRDVRGGQGERKIFRTMFEWLCINHPALAERVYTLVPEYGRWDDIFVALNTEIEWAVQHFVYNEIASGSVLAKKWTPRENKANKDIAKRLMKMWDMTPKEYRQFVSFGANHAVVENMMCKNLWGDINYNHVPSIASKNYRKAFSRHDAERYVAWLKALEDGSPEVKINAGAIFPSDIVGQYLKVEYPRLDRTLEAQWKALPNFVGEGESFIPVVDTSGSMFSDEGIPPVYVALALGIYLSERNKSIFKDVFINFSESPQLNSLSGNLVDKVIQLKNENNWNMNTDFQKVFKLILNSAVRAKVSQEEMPKNIIVLSDMQFDEASDGDFNSTEMIQNMYEKAGYEMPNLIYWNLRTSKGVPVKFDESGTCLVSGYSPSVMASLLGGDFTPMSMMLKVLNSERYFAVEKALTS